MSPFWKNLQGLAKGQLVNGGYLSPDAAATLAARDREAQARTIDPCREKNARREPWPRLAAYR